MTQGLRAQESTLIDLFRPGIEMAMPPYQRSYSWKKPEALDLFNDLIEATETGEPHFIGAIVLVREANGTRLIVDGQQRLTTLTILLAILRDLESDQNQSDQLHAMIVNDKNDQSGNGIAWRVSLNHMDRHFFRESVQIRDATLKQDIEPSGSDSQKYLNGNTDLLRECVKKLSQKDRFKLAETLKTQVPLVKVMVPDWDGGHKVFKVLNTRGKAPNNHDIIKTDLLNHAKLSLDLSNRFSRQWSEHEARLGGSGFDSLLNHIRILYNRNTKATPAGFGKAVLGRIDTRRFLAEELPRYGAAFATVDGDNPDLGDLTDAVRTPLNHLRLIDHHLWRAPALRFLVNHDGDPKTALRFFTMLERLAFAMMLIVTESDKRLRRYGRIAEIADKPETVLAARGPLSLSRDEIRKIGVRLHGRFGSYNQRRAIALRLNAAIDGGQALGPDNGATVEHVLPRNLPKDSPWHLSWPNPAQHRELCDTIGNFVLLSQNANQVADNKGFDEKLALYFQSGEAEYALTRDLQNQPTWTPEIVRTRTKRLAEILMQDWARKI